MSYWNTLDAYFRFVNRTCSSFYMWVLFFFLLWKFELLEHITRIWKPRAQRIVFCFFLVFWISYSRLVSEHTCTSRMEHFFVFFFEWTLLYFFFISEFVSKHAHFSVPSASAFRVQIFAVTIHEQWASSTLRVFSSAHSRRSNSTYQSLSYSSKLFTMMYSQDTSAWAKKF